MTEETTMVANCIFSHNAGGTPADNRAAALNLRNSDAGSAITGNTFYDNDMPMVIDGLVNIDDARMSSTS